MPAPQAEGGVQIRTANNRPPVTTGEELHVPDTKESKGDMARNGLTPGGATAGYISQNTRGGFGPPTVDNNHGTGDDNHA